MAEERRRGKKRESLDCALKDTLLPLVACSDRDRRCGGEESAGGPCPVASACEPPPRLITIILFRSGSTDLREPSVV
jgi:hypothetical protein